MTLMRSTDYAAHRGVTKPAVSRWKREALLVWAPDPKRPGRQLIDVEKSDLVLNGSIDRTRGRPTVGQSQAVEGAGPATEPTSALEIARLDEMRERTTRRRLENEQLLGRLVPLAEYERRAGETGRLVRERCAGIVRQVAERLAAETDPRQVIAILTEEFDRLFDQLADEIESAAKAEARTDAELAAIAGEDLDEEVEEAA